MPRLADASLLVLALGCASADAPPPTVLRVSALPDRAPADVRAQHGGVVTRVCAAVAIRCEWVPAATYEDLVDRFARGDLDLAYFGAATFARAQARGGAIPLVMRDIDPAFTSVIMVRMGDPARALADLRGRRFTFGPRLSTSGHVMPRYFLTEAGLDPESTFTAVGYSAGHDASVALLRQGAVDAAAINSSIAFRLLAAMPPGQHDLRVLWQSPPYADYVWAVRPTMPAGFRHRLRDAFLDLDPGLPADSAALEAENAAGYLPASLADFARITEVMRAAGAL